MPPGDRWACARVTKPLPAQTARQIAPEALIPPEIYSVSFHDPFHAWLATAWHARFHSESRPPTQNGHARDEDHVAMTQPLADIGITGSAKECQPMHLSMTPISAATSASWKHLVESRYAAKSNTGDPDRRMKRSLPTCRVSTCRVRTH
jgi:hypothetical protein